jgi:L-rhamnose mutarotase
LSRAAPDATMSRMVQRHGQVIGLDPDRIADYEAYHRAVPPEVLAMIAACNIRNYSIFRQADRLFAYFEYVGADYAADMARMAADPATRRWWALVGPLQRAFPERGAGDWWMELPEVFHTD